MTFFHSRTITFYRAAAHATGCKYNITYGQLTYDLLQNSALGKFQWSSDCDLPSNLLFSPAEELVSTLHNRYGMIGTSAEGAIGGSTDFVRMSQAHLLDTSSDQPIQGNVTYELPSVHPSFAIPTQPGGGNHTIGFTMAARTQQAHEETLRVAKGLALVGFRVINDDKFFHKVSLVISFSVYWASIDTTAM